MKQVKLSILLVLAMSVNLRAVSYVWDDCTSSTYGWWNAAEDHGNSQAVILPTGETCFKIWNAGSWGSGSWACLASYDNGESWNMHNKVLFKLRGDTSNDPNNPSSDVVAQVFSLYNVIVGQATLSKVANAPAVLATNNWQLLEMPISGVSGSSWQDIREVAVNVVGGGESTVMYLDQVLLVDQDPVLDLKLNETSGTTASDSSGNSYNGTLVNFPTDNSQWVAGFIGNALSFNGSNELVSIAGNASVCNFASFSISFYMKANIQPSQAVLYNEYSSNGSQYLAIRSALTDPNKLEVVCYNGSSYKIAPLQTNSKVFDGQFHNILVIANGYLGTASIYVDYMLDNSATLSSTVSMSAVASVCLGAQQSSGSFAKYYKGVLDEVSTINDIYTQRDIAKLRKQMYPLTCVGRWDFDEMMGTVSVDQSGNSNNALLVNRLDINSNTVGPQWVAGQNSVGGAVSLDGINDEIDVNSAVSKNTFYAVGFFVKAVPPTSGQEMAYLEYTTATQSYLAIALGSNGKLVVNDQDASPKNRFSFVSSSTVADATWHHVLLLDQDGNVDLYIDGIFDTQVTYTPSNFVVGNRNLARIGAGLNTGQFLTGQIDQVRQWTGVTSDGDAYFMYRTSLPLREVIQWNFDKGDARDSSGNGFTGKFNGMIYGDPVFSNGVAIFNGNSSIYYAEDPNCAVMNNGAYSFVFRVKADPNLNTPAYQHGMLTEAMASPNWQAKLVVSGAYGNQMTVYITDITVTQVLALYTRADTPIFDNQWHHVVITNDGVGNVKVYVDGSLNVSGYYDARAVTLPSAPYSNMYCGSNGNYSDLDSTPLIGQMDDVSAWTGELSQQKVLALYRKLPGDINLEGTVNLYELSVLASNWLAHNCAGGKYIGDVNGDCNVDFKDFAIIASNWMAQ